jgi:WhiB family redox-sensing transcriptional regulator
VSVAVVATPWEARAVCRAARSGCFVPPLSGETTDERRAREAVAKGICADCPVRRECLEYALRVREPFGIWGGLNETERRALTGTA